ncbi:hypothetical protein BDA96_04G051500 [Sorghum bicolor]|uniref:Mei2-like C-terminal RNA recognition motif domain-containing protein n=2 Tax=Sorghum bicolor TaxID=4558 RepID=C5XVC4_SORBI|nr:hypothetical protein SORBI_3004G046600 [Sorghum bicolor]KAG0531777.1 hypothetical protein BDA96_04G051500 [Sorghum bicolor]
MSATKLNPFAAPFPCPYPLAPPAPPPFPLADACPPRFPFVTYCCVASPQGHLGLGFCFPVQQCSSPPALRKGVPAAPPHGLPPHKLMAAFSGPCRAGKQRQALPPVPMKPVASAAAADAAPAQVPAAKRKPRMARLLKAESWSQAKAPRPRKARGPRARLTAQREAPPTSLYTKRPRDWVKPEPSELGDCTTIMLRNIPNKLRSGDMISLLDEQCARANRAAGVVVAAYDVLYLPMDFRKEANFGYAFINLTTTAAAKELYCSLQNCCWKVHGSKKVINIDRATQQGKAMLVRHLEKMRLERAKDEFLPVEFSPPRDGVNVPAAPRRIRMARRRGARTASKAKAISS